MKVKNRINLIRSILYMQDVIRRGTITHTAEQNGIKASNLSRLLTELEEALGSRLLRRTSRGIVPTPEGLKIYNLAVEMEKELNNLEKICSQRLINPHRLRIYLSEGIEIPVLKDFYSADDSLETTVIDNKDEADFLILNHQPEKAGENYTRLKIGDGLQQNIWISVNENHPAAMEFFSFITAQLLS